MAGGSGQVFGGEALQHFPNCDGVVASTLLAGDKEGGTAEVGSYHRRTPAGSEEAGKGGNGLVGPVQ